MQISSYNQNNQYFKQKYNISKKDELIIFKVEYFIEGLYIPIITYEIFNAIFSNIYNQENLLLHDKNKDYYIDQYNVYIIERGIDIILYDIKKEFNNKNIFIRKKM